MLSCSKTEGSRLQSTPNIIITHSVTGGSAKYKYRPGYLQQNSPRCLCRTEKQIRLRYITLERNGGPVRFTFRSVKFSAQREVLLMFLRVSL